MRGTLHAHGPILYLIGHFCGTVCPVRYILGGPLLGLAIDVAFGAVVVRYMRGHAMTETKIGGYLYPLRAIAVSIAAGAVAAVGAVLLLVR